MIHVWDSKTGHLVSAVSSGAGSSVLEIHWVAEKNLYLSVHEKEVRFWKVGVISLQQLQEIDAELKGLYHCNSTNTGSSPRSQGYAPAPQKEPPRPAHEESDPKGTTSESQPHKPEPKKIELVAQKDDEESDSADS